MSNTWKTLACLGLLIGSANNALATGIADAATLSAAAERFATARLGAATDGLTVRADPPDPRLALSACAHAPEAFAPPGYRPTLGRQIVGVRCRAPRAWKLYLTVRAERVVPVVVAKRRINRAEPIAAGHLTLSPLPVSTLRQGYYTNVDEAVGHISRQGLNPGDVIVPARLDRQRVVERGQRVTLHAVTNGVAIRMAGIAQANGGVGERIGVRNVSSGRLVEGIVVSSDRIDVAAR